MHSPLLFGFLNLGPSEVLVVLAIGLLLFGRRLPEMGRSLGKGLVEFKKGLHGLHEELGQDPVGNRPATAARVPERPAAPAAGGAAADVPR